MEGEGDEEEQEEQDDRKGGVEREEEVEEDEEEDGEIEEETQKGELNKEINRDKTEPKIPSAYLRAIETITTTFARNLHPINNATMSRCNTIADKLYRYFRSKDSKHFVQNQLVFRKTTKKQQFALDTLIAIYSLPTKNLFRYTVYRSPQQRPRKFSLAQKAAIRCIFKLSSLPVQSIPSLRVKSICM